MASLSTEPTSPVTSGLKPRQRRNGTAMSSFTLSSSPGVLYLPIELVEEILEPLGWRSVAAFAATSRQIHQTIHSSTRLMHKRSLALAGLIDNPHSKHSLKERLCLANERDTRWLWLDERAAVKISVPSRATSYELEDNIFLMTTTPTSLLTIQTGAACASSDPPVWDQFVLPQSVVDFTVAVDDNDLFAFVTKADQDGTTSDLDVHLLQYSTRKPHPAAMNTTLQTGFTLVQDDLYPDLMLSGDFLVVSLRNPHNVGVIVIQFWNWRTGERFFSIENGTGAVVFLSKDLFLIPSSEASSTSQIWIFRIIKDEDDPLSNPEVQRILTLTLPVQSPNVTHRLLECRSHPRRHAPFDPATSGANEHAFFEDPSRSLIRITVKALLADRSVTMATIIFHQKTILDLVSAHESEPYVPQLDWESWGPQSTRVLRSDLWLNWYPTSLSGSRMASLEPRHSSSNEGQGPRMLHVLDFDPLRVRRITSLVKSGKPIGTGYEEEFGISLQKAHVEVVDRDSPTTILASEPGPFGQDVTTYLPYIRSTLLSSKDKSAYVAPRMRDRMSNWMNNQLLMASRKRAWMREAHCRWDSVLMDSTSLIGLKMVRSPDDRSDLSELEVLHLG